MNQMQSPSQNFLLPLQGENSRSKIAGVGKQGNFSSQSQLFTEGPLNTYQDFKNVFNAKHLGPKTNRRQAHQPAFLSSELREPEDKSIRSSSHSIKGAPNIGNLRSDPNSILNQNAKYEQQLIQQNIL